MALNAQNGKIFVSCSTYFKIDKIKEINVSIVKTNYRHFEIDDLSAAERYDFTCLAYRHHLTSHNGHRILFIILRTHTNIPYKSFPIYCEFSGLENFGHGRFSLSYVDGKTSSINFLGEKKFIVKRSKFS